MLVILKWIFLLASDFRRICNKLISDIFPISSFFMDYHIKSSKWMIYFLLFYIVILCSALSNKYICFNLEQVHYIEFV